MVIWQWGLLLLGLVWALQSFGTWRQMRHYADVFKGIEDRYNDGFIGTGFSRGRFIKGTIVLIAASPELKVRRLLTMSGRTVFAKFVRQQQFEGMSLDELRTDPAIVSGRYGAMTAMETAIEQIAKVRSKEEGTAQPT